MKADPRRSTQLTEVLAAQFSENRPEREARHSVHSVRNRDGIRGTNGSESARDIRFKSRRSSASGRNTGLTSGGTPASSSNAVLRCPRASPIS